MSFATVFFNVAKSGGLNQKNVNWYEKMSILYCEKGVIFEAKTEWRNVLAIRSFTAVNKNIPRGIFDDFIIVAWSSNKGESLNWQYFSANTDPSWQYSEEGSKIHRKNKRTGKAEKGIGEDANEDGLNDVGMLPPGAYTYDTSVESHKILKQIFRPLSGDKAGVRVYRDIDRDGYFTQSDEDLVKNQSKMYEGNTMYIHPGTSRKNIGGKGNITWSAGCQTLPQEDFNTFRDIITGGGKFGQKSFTYLLVNSW